MCDQENASMKRIGKTLQTVSIYVEAGIFELEARLTGGRLFVLEGQDDLWKQYHRYSRSNGRIVKGNDHILDALRYGVMMLRHARCWYESGQRRKREPIVYTQRFV